MTYIGSICCRGFLRWLRWIPATGFDDILNFCVKQCEQFGWNKTWGISMVRVGPLSRGLLYLSTPEAVQYVLKDNFENFENCLRNKNFNFES